MLSTAIESLHKTGVMKVAKATSAWVKDHPYQATAILILAILLACTPVFLGAAGFTAGGIVAGSAAASIQAGIGSVAAGSTFAMLTSAGMGGYGLPIVLSGALAVYIAAGGSIVALANFWRGGGSASGSADENLVAQTYMPLIGENEEDG